MNDNYQQKKRKKRFWSLFLVLVMVLSTALPVSATSNNENLTDPTTTDLLMAGNVIGVPKGYTLLINFHNPDGRYITNYETSDTSSPYTIPSLGDVTENSSDNDSFYGWCVYNFTTSDKSGDITFFTLNLVALNSSIEINYNYSSGATNNNSGYYNMDDDPYTLNPLKQAGYQFKSWKYLSGEICYSVDNDVVIKSCKENMVGSRIRLYPEMTTKDYIVVFKDTDGETTVSTDDNNTYDCDDDVKCPSAPSVANGYSFTGWGFAKDATFSAIDAEYADGNYSIDELANQAFDNGFDESNDEKVTLTLYPLKAPTKYTITLDANGGNINDEAYAFDGDTKVYTKHYNIESENTTLPTPTRNGYAFSGWYADKATDRTTSVAKGSTGDKTYKAEWTAIPYSLELHPGNGQIDEIDTSYRSEEISEEYIYYKDYDAD
ncbi:MAG: InlB B-repeat-containing protein, partial [Lachnospiraceae bacterium]|nr:InlB B-repeat-containing protein [Lachnospiraceae bacterium]